MADSRQFLPRLGGGLSFSDMSGIGASLGYSPQTYNSRRTRGGPLTINPSFKNFSTYYNSDIRKWWVVNLGIGGRSGVDNKYVDYYATLEFKLTTALTMSFGPYLLTQIIATQWVTGYTDPNAVNTYNKRYVFAQLDQTTLQADIRADWILSPNLSLQVYIQPYITAGKYSNFKNLKRSKSYDFDIYGEGGSSIDRITSPDGNIIYKLDPDAEGPAAARSIYNPDFKYISLRGNAVLRWEYLPGSALYLVWTQSREDMESIGDFEFNRSMRILVDAHPDNIFMLKLTYWFGV